MIDLHRHRYAVICYNVHRVRCIESGCGMRLTDAEAKVSPRCGKCLSKPETELQGINQGRCGHEAEVFALKWAGFLFVLALLVMGYWIWR